ncbi:MAG: GYD domain-containing protein [Actinomycetota bacterium]|nr:GYD domain-containing protein [Actinomycetota bacterium]
MAKYAVFFRFTSAAVKGLMEHPSDRAAVVASLCSAAGGRMESYYLMFGTWDGFVVFEVPDSPSAAAVSLAVTSTGAFATLETHELIESDDLGGILAKASSLTYTPPGG